MRSQAIKQLVLIILAIIIAVAVIRPELSNIRDDQSNIESYKGALSSIGRYNERLQALLGKAKAMSNADKQALNRYLPSELDKTAVARDITTIAENSGLLVLEVEAEDPEAAEIVRAPDEAAYRSSVRPAATDTTNDPASAVVVVDGNQLSPGQLIAHKFTVQVVGRYSGIKNMLADLERNNYPLRLVEFEFNIEDNTDLAQYDMVIETYSLDFN